MISPAPPSAAILLGLLAFGCAAPPVEKPAPLITSGWSIEASALGKGEGVPPENETAPSGEAPDPGDGTPTGWVRMGRGHDGDGLADARVYKTFQCEGAGESCTVWIRIAIDRVGDGETLVATLSHVGPPSRSETRTLDVLEGYTEVHEVAVRGCGRMRIEVTVEEGPEGAPGVQSEFRVKLDGYLCE